VSKNTSSGYGRVQSLPFRFSIPALLRVTRGSFRHAFERAFMAAPMAAILYATPGGMMTYFSEAPEPTNPAPHSGPVLVMPSTGKPSRPHRWLQRLWLVVFVLFCLEVGIILTVLPWTRLWSDNSLLAGFPAVKAFFANNFVRGLVSGLGLIDIWMGVAEAVTYRER
jgi:hypothetical protein